MAVGCADTSCRARLPHTAMGALAQSAEYDFKGSHKLFGEQGLNSKRR